MAAAPASGPSSTAPSSFNAVVERLTAFTASQRPGPSPRPSSPPLSPNTRPVSPSTLSSSRRAAVLVGLFPHPTTGEVQVLLTLRSSTLSTHGGEVSLPGGKADEADGGDDVRTALREAEEEVGLRPDTVRVLGRCNRVLSKQGMLVTPVVAVIPAPAFDASSPSPTALSPLSFAPALNPLEVSALFALPLSSFLSSADYRFEDLHRPQYSYRLHFFERRSSEWLEVDSAFAVRRGEGDERRWTVWGMTASVLISVARQAFDRQPDFAVPPHSARANAASAAPPPLSLSHSAAAAQAAPLPRSAATASSNAEAGKDSVAPAPSQSNL